MRAARNVDKPGYFITYWHGQPHSFEGTYLGNAMAGVLRAARETGLYQLATVADNIICGRCRIQTYQLHYRKFGQNYEDNCFKCCNNYVS